MLRSLKLHHFRCFDRFEASFQPGLNFIVGPNAHGKTSLLEAACILLRLQSPRISKLSSVVQHARRGFAVDGFFDNRHLQFYFSTLRKKLLLDGVAQKSAHEYLQVGRVVYFSNTDIEIARGSSDVRRRFLDFVGAQRHAGYRAALRAYERALRSRNLLLKGTSPRLREIIAFEEPMIAAGDRITEARRELLAALHSPGADAYGLISAARESFQFEYVSGSGENFAVALEAARTEDTRLRQTTVGPHRDDIRFSINGESSAFASEGQQRTLVLALKVAAAVLLEQVFGTAPLLLLDDIFGELDPERRNALFGALPPASQKLVTTTHLDWLVKEEAATLLRLA